MCTSVLGLAEEEVGVCFGWQAQLLLFYKIMARVRNLCRRVFVNKYINFWKENFLGGLCIMVVQ